MEFDYPLEIDSKDLSPKSFEKTTKIYNHVEANLEKTAHDHGFWPYNLLLCLLPFCNYLFK